jgi:single-stranded DNA-binding protein
MYSKLIIVGNLGRDPEQRFTTKAEPVTSFSVARVGEEVARWQRR